MNQLPEISRKREKLLATYPSLLENIKKSRVKTINTLEAMVHKATESLVGKRAHVYYASTSVEALKTFKELLAKEKEVVRTYSNTLKEVGLDQFLQQEEIVVFPTDTAEIIDPHHLKQSLGHPLLKGLGFTTEQVIQGLERFLGNTAEDLTPQTLNCLAHKKIKEAIIRSTFGLTGANSIVAENGTMIIAEDEGNGRAVSNLTYQHIAIVGIDKITDTAEEAMEIIQGSSILGLGKDFPTYISLISGPSRTADIELRMAYGMHGPKETHVILLDNGRTQLKNKGFGELLHCINCGFCFETCQKIAIDNNLSNITLTPKSIALATIQGKLPNIKNIHSLETFHCPLGISKATIEDCFNNLRPI